MDRAADPAARRLLDVADAMLGELRRGAPRRSARLDDRIDLELGLDSLSRVELAMRIEREFGVRLPDGLATGARTLRDVLAAIPAARANVAERASPTAPAPPPEAVYGTPDDAVTLVDAFRWHLDRHPDREHVTLLDGDAVVETLTYARLWSGASEVARGLRAAGVAREDAVALMLPTGREFFEAFLGAILAGGVPVPLYPPLRWSEIEEHVGARAAILANAQARVLVTVPEAMFVGRVVRAGLASLAKVTTVDRLRVGGAGSDSPSLAARDVAMLQYTSGSTGSPKGVILGHDNLLANIRALGRAAQATSTDRFVSWLPLYHDMGLIGAWLCTMYHGVPLVLMPPQSFLARPSRWLRAIHRHGGTLSAGPNFAYEIAASRILDDELTGLDLSTWRLAFNGAEPVRAATLARFADRYARYGFDRRALLPVYGLAECAVGLTFPPLGRGPRVERIDADALARRGRAEPSADAARAVETVSCGMPLPGHEVRVVDEAGRELPERGEGRVEFRGPSATRGYQRNPEATRRLVSGGWLDTGDVGYVAGGELFLTSRAKDLIKRGGHNLHPYDLEAAVGELAGVRKGCVAVFGAADRARGTERVVVVAETHPLDVATRAALEAQIVALSATFLDGPADEVLLVPARTVPKTSSGKIRRAACRALYEAGTLEARRPAVWRQLVALGLDAFRARLLRAAHATAAVGFGVYAWAAFATIAPPCVLAIALAPRPSARYRIAHGAARLLLAALRIPLAVDGPPRLSRTRPAVLVANHASYVDALVLVAALPEPVHFAAKRELARAPLVGAWLARFGTYYLERVDPAAGVEDTRELVAAIARGETIVMFPEGTFSRAPGLRPFRLGAFAIGAETGAPVIPVVLRGTRSLLREGRWLPAPGPIAVNVLAPLAADGRDWSAAVRLRDRVRAAVLDACDEPDLAD